MIIDFHTHVFPDKIAERTVSALSAAANIPPHSDGKLSGLVRSMREAGVDVAVNLPVLTSPGQFDSVLRFAIGMNERFSETGILSFAGVHPEMDGIREKMREIRRAGIRGVKLHPDYQGHFIDDDGYVEILKAAKDEGLIVVTHAGVDGAFTREPVKCTPKRTKTLLARIGGYDRLVLAHLGANEMAEEVYETLAGEDVYFDTAYVLSGISEDTFKKILSRHTRDRILFATDSPWQNEARNVERLRSFGLGGSDEKKILAENAKKLLEL